MTLTLTHTGSTSELSTGKLLTLDETRSRIAESGLDVLRRCHTRHAPTVSAILWGAVDMPGLDDHDRHLSAVHRSMLDVVDSLGHLAEAPDELDGIASAVGLVDGFVGPPPF